MQSKKTNHKKPNYKLLTIIYAVIIFGYIAVANYLSSKSFVRIDLTENSVYTVSESAKNIIGSLTDRVTVEVYFSDNLPPNFKSVRSDLKDILTELKQYSKGNLNIVWKHPVSDDADRTEASSLGIPAVQVQSIEKDKAETVKGYMGVAIKFGGKYQIIPAVQGTSGFEYEFLQKIVRLTQDESPRIAILKTDTALIIDEEMAKKYRVQPRPDQTHAEFMPIFDALTSNYRVSFFDLTKASEIDPAIKTLIIPGGTDGYFLNIEHLKKIDNYLMSGGNLIVLARKVWVNLSNPQGPEITVQNSLFYEMLKSYGVEVEPKLVVDASCSQISVPKKIGQNTVNVPVNFPLLVRVNNDGFNKDNPAVSGIPQMVMPWVSPLKIVDTLPTGVVADTLASSSLYSYAMENRFRLNPNRDWQKVFAQKESSGELNRFPLMVQLTGEFPSFFAKESTDSTVVTKSAKTNIVVAGTADFLSVGSNGGVNAPFIQNIADQLTLSENLISIRTRSLVDRTIDKSTLTGNHAQGSLYRIINIGLMPLLLIAFGVLVFIRRKKIQQSVK